MSFDDLELGTQARYATMVYSRTARKGGGNSGAVFACLGICLPWFSPHIDEHVFTKQVTRPRE